VQEPKPAQAILAELHQVFKEAERMLSMSSLYHGKLDVAPLNQFRYAMRLLKQ
jgi:hypothetical protein